LQPLSIGQAFAVQDGLHLPGQEIRAQFAKRNVSQVMQPATEIFQANMTVQEAFDHAQQSKLNAWPVVENAGIDGIVRRGALQRAITAGEGEKRLKDLVGIGIFPHVHADHPLDVAMERMGVARLDLLPVVSRANVRSLIGVVQLPDILNSFGVGASDAENPLA
jgi:predicted transcriptional regulator